MTNNETIAAIRELPERKELAIEVACGCCHDRLDIFTDDLKALADSIERAEAELRAKLVAEIKAVKAKCPWTDGEIAYDRAIEIVRGEGGQ